MGAFIPVINIIIGAVVVLREHDGATGCVHNKSAFTVIGDAIPHDMGNIFVQ